MGFCQITPTGIAVDAFLFFTRMQRCLPQFSPRIADNEMMRDRAPIA